MELFQRADALRAELLSSIDQRVVLHGDLHHFNILRCDRGGWLAIDPKGLVGDRYFDVCQFLLNPEPVPASVSGVGLNFANWLTKVELVKLPEVYFVISLACEAGIPLK